MRGFTLKEKQKLVEMAKDSKTKGYSLTRVFNEFAKESNRASGSVRNFYYDLIKDDALKELQANEIIPFTKCETARLIAQILTNAGGGKSVRRVIAEMATDEKHALRIQNKYRNVIKREKSFVLNVIEGLKRKGVEYLDPYKKQKEKQTFVYNRLKREIDGLLERLTDKQKNISEELLLKLRALQEENESLKEQSKIFKYYEKPIDSQTVSDCDND